MKKILEHRIVDHGVGHAQYFQGHGTSFTNYTDCATGCGDTPGEALADALEMLASSGDYDDDQLGEIEDSEDGKQLKASKLNAHCACACGHSKVGGCSACDGAGTWHEGCELHYYVSIDLRAEWPEPRERCGEPPISLDEQYRDAYNKFKRGG